MVTFRSIGDVVELTAPAGGVTKDVPVQIGQLIVIPTVSADATVKFNGITRGVVSGLTKVGSQAWTEGEVIYWDAETDKLTDVAGDNHEFGRALEAVGSGAGETESGEVLFNGMLAAADETT